MPGHDEPQIELDRSDPGDVVEFGGTPGRPAPPWRRLILPAVVVCAVVAAVVAYTRTDHPSAGPSRPSPTPAAPTTPTAPTTATALPSITAPIMSPGTVSVGGPLLGVTDRWEVFALSATALIRIEPAAGRITQTPVPRLTSDGLVSLVPTDRGAVILPADRVAGYLVPDGQPAMPLTGLLTDGGRALPGPRPGTLWIEMGGGILQLVDTAGRRLHDRLTVPEAIQAYPVADGSGYVLAVGIGGTYSVRATGIHRISTGNLLAVGLTGWMTIDCDDRAECATVVTDSRTGTTRRVPDWNGMNIVSAGAISPDGRSAAFIDPSSGRPEVDVLDLATGQVRTAAVDLERDYDIDTGLVWTPDSRWLLYPDPFGNIQALDPRTAQSTTLLAGLFRIIQIALRPAL
jgi:hypothetical protein